MAACEEGLACSSKEVEDRETDCSSRSSEKAPAETEISVADDKEDEKESPSDIKSQNISSHDENIRDEDLVKILTDKLSSALRDVQSNEELAKQHAKVAEEAVSGWEKAEREVVTLKQQFELALHNYTTLEEKNTHLDSALKECVRELRQSREDQDQKSRRWESETNDLKTQISKLETLLEAEQNSQTKLEAMEKENEYLKSELLAQSEELNIRTLERELSTQAAEIASKQHLESIKKIAKLESECLRLRSAIGKKPSNDHKLTDHRSQSNFKKPSNDHKESVSAGSLTDSLSDGGDRLIGSDIDPSCSDSWASALIVELDQFKGAGLNPSGSCPEIDLMDDFVQMEKLAALTETTFDRPPSETTMNFAEFEEKVRLLESEKADMEVMLSETRDRLDKENKVVEVLQKELQMIDESRRSALTALESAEGDIKILESRLEAVLTETTVHRPSSETMMKFAEFEEKIRLLETEKADVEVLLSQTRDKLEKENKVVEELQKELQRIDDSRRSALTALESVEGDRKNLESRLEAAVSEVHDLKNKIDELERKNEEDQISYAELALKYRDLEDELLRRNQEAELARATTPNGELKMKQDKELAVAAGKLAECQKTIASLGQQLRSLANLGNQSMEEEVSGPNGPSSFTHQLGVKLDSPKGPDLFNGRGDLPSPSSSASSFSGPWRSLPGQGNHSHLHI